MKVKYIEVIGAGYVGLVTAACLADKGHYVMCVDTDEEKIKLLKDGIIPIHEPGLKELIVENQKQGRLLFSSNFKFMLMNPDFIYLAVGTPSNEDGSVNLSYLKSAAISVAQRLCAKTIIICKSTVPVGTNKMLAELIDSHTDVPFEVVSNPEFLKEGSAIDDFNNPDRVVIGSRSSAASDRVEELNDFENGSVYKVIKAFPESAELIKYASNAMLASRISFINEISNLCEHCGADIDEVKEGIGADKRIGGAFLNPGVGYGGSCFPKDIQGLAQMGNENNIILRTVAAIFDANELQKRVMYVKLYSYFRDNLYNKRIAIWGLAFKPETDDIREAPALSLINTLLDVGVTVVVHDPEAMDNVRAIYGDKLIYCNNKEDALDNADALVIMTEWDDYKWSQFLEMKNRMKKPVVFDGRNIYKPSVAKMGGLTYISMGRKSVNVEEK